MSDEIRLTAAQRAAGIDRVGENVALLSGAGCGKTFVLARRFAELLLQSDPADADPLRGLVALTFTDKAATEMSQRVRRMLTDFAAQADGPRRRRLMGWIDDLAEARISTIHSFCASLLRSCAVEAGLDPAFSVAADTFYCESLAKDAADAAVLARVQAEDHDVADLLTHVTYEQLIELVCELLDLRTTADYSAYGDPAKTLGRWRELTAAQADKDWAALANDPRLAAEIDKLDGTPCADAADKLAVRLAETMPVIKAMLSETSARTADNFAGLTRKIGNIGSAKAWGSRETVTDVRRRLGDLIAAVEPLSIYCRPLGEADRRAAEIQATLVGLSDEAVLRYAAVKRARGILDFTDLLDYTHRLLRDKPAIRRALADPIRQVLIDECQDTDAFQMAMLRMLAVGEDEADAIAPGRLFLVGDAKQSIYRFRGAQVEVFEESCRDLGPQATENLDLSFRTHAAGAAFVNHLFATLMGEDYSPITAHRTETPDHPSVEILLAEGTDEVPIDSAATANHAQAALTAQRIDEMLRQGERLVWGRAEGGWRAVRAGDVAILFARMTNSLDYERQLQLRGIPYHVLAGTGFFRQQEVFDVLNALRVIDNPYDDVALFGVLRSSLVGLDDNALMHVAESLDPPYLPKLAGADLGSRLGDEQAGMLAAACALLTDLHRDKDALGIGETLERLLGATGFEAMLLCQFQGRRMLGNVRLLLDRARSADADGVALADFVAQIGELVINESREEQAAVTGEAEDVVRLLTIHKAKGLEFPVVFIPDLNAGRREDTSPLLHRHDWGLTCRLGGDDEDEPVAWRVTRRLEKRDRCREDIRRLYVAATRHEDHLVFVGADHRTKEGVFKATRSYLAQMDAQLGIASAVDGGQGAVPYGDAFTLRVERVACRPPARPDSEPMPGRRHLSAAASGTDLAERIIAAAGSAGDWPAVTPLGAHVGGVELAVTALSEFDHCPMLYRWRYELRVPAGGIPAPPGGRGTDPRRASEALDPATLGTLLHRCMELLDFGSPQDGSALVGQAAAELGLDDHVALDAVAEQFRAMLETFRGHRLRHDLAEATRTFRELDFLLDVRPAELRGQIDMLYQDAAGRWHVVDYKSDRVRGEDVARHAGRYELQLLAYAVASRRQIGGPPDDAVLYFLRTGQTHTFDITPRALAAAADRIAALSAELVAARRTGRFARKTGESCASCRYGDLCRRDA